MISGEKYVTRSPFELLRGTASNEDRPTGSGIRKRAGNIVFFVGNRTPLAVFCLYLRSSHSPSRTAVFLPRLRAATRAS